MVFPFDDCLYFLSNVSPFILVIAPLEFDSKEKIVYKREVEVSRSLKNIDLVDPSLLYIPTP